MLAVSGARLYRTSFCTLLAAAVSHSTAARGSTEPYRTPDRGNITPWYRTSGSGYMMVQQPELISTRAGMSLTTPDASIACSSRTIAPKDGRLEGSWSQQAVMRARSWAGTRAGMRSRSPCRSTRVHVGMVRLRLLKPLEDKDLF